MSKTHKLTDINNNSVIDCDIDDQIEITLVSNPSTGFLWQSIDTSAGVLDSLQHDASTGVPRASHNIRFLFSVKRSGHFTLNYARPWGDSTPAEKWFSVTVNVN